MNDNPLPSNPHEIAKRLVREWSAINAQDPTTSKGFVALLNRLLDEGLDVVDHVVALAAQQLGNRDRQAQLRCDVMARAAHLEAMGHSQEKGVLPALILADAFVVPAMGDLAAMSALMKCPEAMAMLVEGMGEWGNFKPSRVALAEAWLPVEMANRPSLAKQLAHEIGLLSISSEADLLEAEESALLESLEAMAMPAEGKGVAVLAGVRVWVGSPDDRPGQNDLLLHPESLRTLDRLGNEMAWEDTVREALNKAELMPGSVALFPPSTFLRGFAQGRALQLVQAMCEGAAKHGISDRIDHVVTRMTNDDRIMLVAVGSDGSVLAHGPSVPTNEIHVEGQAFLEMLRREGGSAQPRTQMNLRRRGFH